jgi:hypothetical protein
MDIATTMHAKCREDGEHDEQIFWGFISRSVDEMTAAGMSDEEDGWDGEERVKLVHGIDFRRLEFRQLFEEVDETPSKQPLVFIQSGRRRMRRKESGKVIKRQPPPGVAPGSYRPEYLDAMHRGEVPIVQLGRRDYSPSRSAFSCFR